MERFGRSVEGNRETEAEWEEFSLEPDRETLSFMLEIDREIFEAGDCFLQRDLSFLDDRRKIEILALGEVLAETSIRHGCLEFWPRLREMGPTPQMVREARGWWLLANIDLEPKYDFYSHRLEDTIAEFDPEVEKIVAKGGFAVEAMRPGNGGWVTFSVMQGMSTSTKRELLGAYLRRDKVGVERIYDRVASEAEAEARKGNHSLFLRGRVQRVEGRREPDTYCDMSFLRFASEWEEVTARGPSPQAGTLAPKGIPRTVRHRGRSRSRCSHGHTRRRTVGSRRSSSSDDGGGGGSDPPPLYLAEPSGNPPSPSTPCWDSGGVGLLVLSVKLPEKSVGGPIDRAVAEHLRGCCTK
ncbi:MAG: hypothetical protein ACTHN3_00885 [Solirubrobacterales bacterium]